MAVQKTPTFKFNVQVKVDYVESESRPESQYYFFTYRIFIENKSSEAAQLMSRHWIITDGNSQTEEVRGAGVVGMQPKIQANKQFEYESACTLTTSSGSMKGFYQFVSDSGESFEIEIPEFYLIAPTALH